MVLNYTCILVGNQRTHTEKACMPVNSQAWLNTAQSATMRENKPVHAVIEKKIAC